MTDDYRCQECGFVSGDPQSIREHDCNSDSLERRVRHLCANTPPHQLQPVKAVHLYISCDKEWQIHTDSSQGYPIMISRKWNSDEVAEFVAVDVLGWSDCDTITSVSGKQIIGWKPIDHYLHDSIFEIYFLQNKDQTRDILMVEWEHD